MWWRLVRTGGAGLVCPVAWMLPDAKGHHTCRRQLLGQRSAKRVCIYGSQELKGACKAMGVLADFAMPHRPQTNGVAERAARRVLEGLEQCYCPVVFHTHGRLTPPGVSASCDT
jgi:hypothetical protein